MNSYIHSEICSDKLWVQKCTAVVSGLDGLTQWTGGQYDMHTAVLRSNFSCQDDVRQSCAQPQRSSGSRGLWQTAVDCIVSAAALGFVT